MSKISLVAMPTMEVNRPAIALTQLKSVLKQRLGDRVKVEILYLYHDFARYMAEGQSVGGTDLYQILVDNQKADRTGLPDWFFRPAAFPHVPENSDQYFRRYFPGHSNFSRELKEAILERQRGLDGFFDQLIDEYQIDTARIVGLSSMFAQNIACFAMARKLKERNPNLTIAMGGANCETPMGQEIAKNVPAVDYVFSGPALVSFPELVQHHLDDKIDECDNIKGVFSKTRPHRDRSEQIGEELDINADVDLDYSEFFESFDRHFPGSQEEPMVFFETSRGCWWGERSHCTFCGLNGQTMNYRAMAPDKAIDLIQGLFARYGDRSSYFFCVDNIMPREYLKDVFSHITPPPGAKIFYEVKADLKEEALRTMSNAGVTVIQPGIEALATSSLTLMKKGTTAFVNLRLLKNVVKYDMTPAWNLLVGFPGEPEDVYDKYVRDMPRTHHLPPPMALGQVRFDRYSPYFVQAKEYGLELRHLDFYKQIYPFDESALNNLAYFFMDSNFDAAHFKILSKWIGPLRERIEGWQDRWNGKGDGTRPRLELHRNGGSAVVRDTRASDETEHELNAEQVKLLDYLERPRKLKDVLFESGLTDVEQGLEFLDDRGLVWREGERYMSLVTGAHVQSAPS